MSTTINDYIVSAINYAFDESIGYHMGGNFNPDTDCSGFVWQCLYDNGFNVGGSRFDTSNMGGILEAAGFTRYTYSNSFIPQHGDIFMWDEYDAQQQRHNGHTFFYAENVYGYLNGHQGWQNCDGSTGTCQYAKIEASDVHGHPEAGDQDNGNGAHTEVWSHTYSSLTYGSHIWNVYRYQGAPVPAPDDLVILKVMTNKNFTLPVAVDEL